jgi:tetratricopeptide (TPR) repeat protein
MSCLQQAIDLYERGHTLNREGKHSSALPVLCEANEVAQGGLEENTTLRGEIQYTLGFVLSQLGQLQDAEERFRSAIQTFTTTLQENDNVIAISKYRYTQRYLQTNKRLLRSMAHCKSKGG